jgi:hypothetical protein
VQAAARRGEIQPAIASLDAVRLDRMNDENAGAEQAQQ